VQGQLKEKEKLETRKLVMKYSLALNKEKEGQKNKRVFDDHTAGDDGFDIQEDPKPTMFKEG